MTTTIINEENKGNTPRDNQQGSGSGYQYTDNNQSDTGKEKKPMRNTKTNFNKTSYPLFPKFGKGHYYTRPLNITDVDGLKYEIVQAKNQNYNRSKEYLILQESYYRLDTESQCNMKLIETLLGKQQLEGEAKDKNKDKDKDKDHNEKLGDNKNNNKNEEQKEKDNGNANCDDNGNDREQSQTEESTKVKRLKREIIQYQRQLDMKNEELYQLSQTPKVIAMKDTENKLKEKETEIKRLIIVISTLENKNYERKQAIVLLNQSIASNKAQSATKSSSIKEAKKRHQDIEAKIKELQATKEQLESKAKAKEDKAASLKAQMKEKTNEFNKATEDHKQYDAAKNELDEYERRDQATIRKLKMLRKDNDKLKKKKEEAKIVNKEYIDKAEEYEKEKPMLIERAKDPPTTHRQKENQIKELQEELNRIIEGNYKRSKECEEKTKVTNDEIAKVSNENEEYNKKIEELTEENDTLNESLKQLEEEFKLLDEKDKENQKVVMSCIEKKAANEEKERDLTMVLSSINQQAKTTRAAAKGIKDKTKQQNRDNDQYDSDDYQINMRPQSRENSD